MGESTWNRPGTPEFIKKYGTAPAGTSGIGCCTTSTPPRRQLNVDAVWKLYPWEWLAQEEIGQTIERNAGADALPGQPLAESNVAAYR